MVKIQASYQKGLSCRATHGPSGTTLMTDAPVDNNGLGRSFSPTDLLATAMGTCMMTIMGIVAEREGLDINGSTVEVEKHMTTTSPRRVAKLVVNFRIRGVASNEHREKLVRAARACPVHHSLHPEVVCDVGFEWEVGS
jgi:putative redox protein